MNILLKFLFNKFAKLSNSFFINQRWLGGLLTNWSTIKICIEKLKKLCDYKLEIRIKNIVINN